MSEIELIHQDNHLLAVNKPAGLLTQPSGTEYDNLEDRAKQWIKRKAEKPGKVFLEAVHRIDTPVSGVVLFAKTSKALSRLNAASRERQFTKVYFAVVDGPLPGTQGVLEHNLEHRHRHAVVVPVGKGKPARLSYHVIHQSGRLKVLEIHLETGRYHQIRAQLAAVGCPIVGDNKYGSAMQWPGEGIGLHHRELEVPHPVLDRSIRFQAPLPSPWHRLLPQLEA